MRVQQVVHHAQQRRLTLAADAYFSQCEVVESGHITCAISAMNIADNDALAIEWAIHNSQMLLNSAENLGQEENKDNVPRPGNKMRQRHRITIAKDVGNMLIEIAAQNADTTTVNLWIDALKVSLGTEHTHAVFKCMQEAYLAGTKDAYVRLQARIWLARSSRNTAKHQLASHTNACSTLLDMLENDNNCQAMYSRHLLQKEIISVSNEVQRNNARIHAAATAYYYADINSQKQDSMATSRLLPSSAGACENNYANEHHIHISERATRVSISVYLDIVQAIRQHNVRLHPLSTVSKTHPYRLCEYDTETGEYSCVLYREDAMNFIHSYNVRGPCVQEDFILWLVDSGTTSFLSNLLRHMFIQIPCNTTINGVGQAVCDTCAPLILHCISEDDLTYISIHGPHVYYMPHLKFPILSTGIL
jgi:hypothetical protein